MPSRLVDAWRSFTPVRIASIAVLTLLLCGWGTCSAVFVSCQGLQPEITSLSPANIPADAESVLLTVNGHAFAPGSQIMWNGSALRTRFVDSRHLQAKITNETFDSFGAQPGNAVEISVRSQGSDSECPPPGNSTTRLLAMD